MHRYTAKMYHADGGGTISRDRGFLAFSDEDAEEQVRRDYRADPTILEVQLIRARGGNVVIFEDSSIM